MTKEESEAIANGLLELARKKRDEALRKIPGLRKKHPSDFCEIQKLIDRLGELLGDGRITDQAQELFKKIHALWMKGLPNSLPYVASMYSGFYSEKERLTEKERDLLCFVRDFNDSQKEKLKSAFEENFKEVAQKIIDSLKEHPEFISNFVKKMYAYDEERESFGVVFELLGATKWSGWKGDGDSELQFYFTDNEELAILKSICEILNVANKLDCVNFDCIPENGYESFKVKMANIDLLGKQKVYIAEQSSLFVQKNELSEAHLNGLFSICENVLLRPYDFEDLPALVFHTSAFIEMLPMTARYDALG